MRIGTPRTAARTETGWAERNSSSSIHRSFRSVDPQATIDRLEPYLARLGITRVANITGLDRIGIPVSVAIRPNSRSLSVSQGKGLDHASAKASAIGESIEAHHAEYNNCTIRLETCAYLRARVRLAEPELLPLARNSSYADTHPMPWTEGFDLLHREPVWVPYELVHANACLPRVPGSGCFVCSTNGLAAGNTHSEAMLHGLCELVERDACALWERKPPEARAATQVLLDSIENETCRELLDRFDEAGVDVLLWDVTSDLPLPVYRAIIVDREIDPVLAPTPGAFGAGCHPLPVVALVRALTEAAQSRLTIIAGARDDLTRERYRTVQAATALNAYRELADGWRGRVEFRRSPSAPRTTVEDHLSFCVEAVASIGLGQVVAVDLAQPEFPISVIRAIVPGLEGPVESPAYRPGPRARALAT